MYWACVVPTTIVTFTLWAGITQRGQILKLMRSRRDRDPEKAEAMKSSTQASVAFLRLSRSVLRLDRLSTWHLNVLRRNLTLFFGLITTPSGTDS